ncbi:MAG TPA: ATP-binding protein, partial [Gemmatimonadaceae bacterium]|nr:ATP-binding protein [Gemmatimonadaceae bacterium]
RSLVLHSSDIIAVVDEIGHLTDVSESSIRLTGQSRETLLRHPVDTVVHPDETRDVFEFVRRTATDPQPPAPRVFRLRRADGRWARIETIGTNLLRDPAVRGVVLNGRDVTDRMDLEEQLRHAQKLDAVGRLAGGIAHDFNNILTAIRATASLLLESLPGGDPRRSDCEEIERTVDRAAGLTRQLLVFSRQQLAQPQVIALAPLVHDMEPMLRRLLTASIRLHVDAPAATSAVEVDPHQLQQVVLNLVVNAREAMPHGGTLRIEVADDVFPPSGAAAGTPAVRLSVRDDGCGIAEDVRPHLFEPFFTTKPGNSGLGLSTVFGIVRQSGGEIRVTSEVGAGTCFSVYLQRVPSVDSGVPASSEASAPAPASAQRRLLVVDDEPVIRRVVERYLVRRGYDVLSAANGREALERLAEAEAAGSPVDLLLTDIVMPEMDGGALIAATRLRRPDLPIIAMSGHLGESAGDAGEGMPGDAFLAKPFGLDVLADVVAGLLERSEAAV